MKINDLASIIAIRNYAVTVRENKNVFRGETYAKINARIAELDRNIALVICDMDVDAAFLNGETSAPVDAPLKVDGPGDTNIVISNDGVTIVTPKSATVSTKSNDDDEAYMAKRLAEEKAKVEKRKKATAKVKSATA